MCAGAAVKQRAATTGQGVAVGWLRTPTDVCSSKPAAAASAAAAAAACGDAAISM